MFNDANASWVGTDKNGYIQSSHTEKSQKMLQ